MYEKNLYKSRLIDMLNRCLAESFTFSELFVKFHVSKNVYNVLTYSYEEGLFHEIKKTIYFLKYIYVKLNYKVLSNQSISHDTIINIIILVSML